MRLLQKRKLLLALLCLATVPVDAALTPRDGKWVEANQVMLRYELSGTGRTAVVLIHDMGMNLEAWDEVVPALGGYRILRYDMRGFGLSEKFRTPVELNDHVEDLRGLLDALNIKGKVIVCGGSAGGAIALMFAIKYPDRVKAVVGLNAVTQIHRKSPPLAANQNPGLLGRDTAKLFETEGVRAYLKQDLDWLYPAQLRTPERLSRFMGIELAQDPQVRALYMRMSKGSVDINDLPMVRAPTLLIAGMVNSSYTADEWKQIAAAIPHARLEMIKTAHHAAFESPELVIPLLKAFFKQYN
jgi:pimeloyl-ACP methyl ester carboxylesterase